MGSTRQFRRGRKLNPPWLELVARQGPLRVRPPPVAIDELGL